MRNPLHSICPYFAMFPETFVQNYLLAYSRPGDQIFDPFCGRGTTILESLLNNRDAIGVDINPVAACVAGAKADVPEYQHVLARINELQDSFEVPEICTPLSHEFFAACFHTETLQHILYLRSQLKWEHSKIDRFIAAMALGVLHGESHKTELCFSNRMPRTISTKPDYSVRWWREKGLTPPRRHAFEILRKCAEFRLLGEVPSKRGRVVLSDARQSGRKLKAFEGRVSLVITSPPYLDTTDYAEDQWLRLWFLGGPDRPTARLHRDDRHTNVSAYWKFLSEVWAGSEALLADECHIVVRIGGTMLVKAALFEGLMESLQSGLRGRRVNALHAGETSTIKRRQTNSFRPGTSAKKLEHDFVFRVR